jgi:hypothetical protein
MVEPLDTHVAHTAVLRAGRLLELACPALLLGRVHHFVKFKSLEGLTFRLSRDIPWVRFTSLIVAVVARKHQQWACVPVDVACVWARQVTKPVNDVASKTTNRKDEVQNLHNRVWRVEYIIDGSINCVNKPLATSGPNPHFNCVWHMLEQNALWLAKDARSITVDTDKQVKHCDYKQDPPPEPNNHLN